MRKFTDSVAKREAVPLLVGLVGPSSSGKTMSALRIATGMQEVTGGDIFCIDTEAKRALHYADQFRFRHLPFEPPFSPLDYLAAIEHCHKKGGKIIIVDSMSHEHEGPGGVLEMHDEALTRMAGEDWKRREKLTFAAWAKPKLDRNRMVQSILQIGCSFIFCFRAQEKIKPRKGEQPEHLGFQPISGKPLVYEMTVRALLPPSCNGVPDWSPELPGERGVVKLPEYFKDIFLPASQLAERHGSKMAEWARGGQAEISEKNSAATTEPTEKEKDIARLRERIEALEGFQAGDVLQRITQKGKWSGVRDWKAFAAAVDKKPALLTHAMTNFEKMYT